MSHSVRRALILMLLLGILAGCAPVAPATAPAEPVIATTVETPATGASEPVDASAEGGTVYRALTSEPANLDPQGAPHSGLSLVLPYLFDTLVVLDLDNSVHPLLADSWVTSADGKTITMTLKSGVTFHDGTPLNAEAVKFTFERFQEVGKASPIYGGIAQMTGIEAVDELTVRFTFDTPAANFWSTVAMPYAGIISPASAEAAAAAADGAAVLVGTGPFILEDWKAGQSISLVHNPAYAWGPDLVDNRAAPHLERQVFTLIPEASTQLAALEKGEVDILFVNNPAHKRTLEGNPDVQLHEAVLNSLVYLGFNCSKAPFDDPTVRRALSHAVNKEEIVKVALGGLGQVADAPLPPTLPGYSAELKEHALAYDPTQAEALLQQAGFQRDAGGTWSRDGAPLTVVLLTSTRAPNETIATLVQSQLAAIGVEVETQMLDSKAVMAATTEGAFDLLLWRYDWNDPDALNIYLGSDRIGSTNRVAYNNPQVDALLAQGAHEMDEAARAALYVEAQKLILADAPWQPLYYPVDIIATGKRLQGSKVGYMGRLLLNDATVTD
jgi:peptide/nickel transport system substrate-binding protein